MASHAAYPTPVLLSSDRLRIFFNVRDAESRGFLVWLDVDPAEPLRVLRLADEPALKPGALGTFDDRGLSNGSIHRHDAELWLYYMGWNKSADVPFRNAIGLAIARDGEGRRFERLFEGPLVDRSRFDPFTLSYPYVVPSSSGRSWRMYYGSSRAGGDREENMHHVLTEATSTDGIDWRPTGHNLLPLAEGEYGMARPWLISIKQRTYLLYSIRRTNYRIGLSVLDNTTGRWQRLSDDLLGPSDASWDNAATCYPAAIGIGGEYYLFYCGNGYGRTGFGVARLEG